jgi:hypothetical protein
MSKISKTAQASMTGPVEVKKDLFDTNEKKIKELRNQRRDRLAVNRFDFIDALIEEYDKVQLLLAQEIANVVVSQTAAEAVVERISKFEIELTATKDALLVEQLAFKTMSAHAKTLEAEAQRWHESADDFAAKYAQAQGDGSYKP